ncbi:hypothetical protein Ade02nite_89640 [Paractinoplanes deccanensis]|uniref:Uncharacterized protein n=1 Tax=Paractinoplanes deccanensis TaxID=113561 RepID=A0ABQ3YK11_9ACTN|nr:hypothetical protein Ade02nite_89640 [Actinoplanes deccanensis]
MQLLGDRVGDAGLDGPDHLEGGAEGGGFGIELRHRDLPITDEEAQAHGKSEEPLPDGWPIRTRQSRPGASIPVGKPVALAVSGFISSAANPVEVLV